MEVEGHNTSSSLGGNATTTDLWEVAIADLEHMLEEYDNIPPCSINQPASTEHDVVVMTSALTDRDVEAIVNDYDYIPAKPAIPTKPKLLSENDVEILVSDYDNLNLKRIAPVKPKAPARKKKPPRNRSQSFSFVHFNGKNSLSKRVKSYTDLDKLLAKNFAVIDIPVDSEPLLSSLNSAVATEEEENEYDTLPDIRVSSDLNLQVRGEEDMAGEDTVISEDRVSHMTESEQPSLSFDVNSNKVQDMENKITQINNMISQFDKLVKAKDIALVQATKTLKKHTSSLMDKIKFEEERLVAELNARYSKDIKQVANTRKELEDSLTILKDTLASAYTGLNINMDSPSSSISERKRSKRDSGYAGSETGSIVFEMSEDDWEKWHVNQDHTMQQVDTRLTDMLHEVPNIIWGQRTVVRFVRGGSLPRLGAFQECYMTGDYNRVTKCRAYSFSKSDDKPKFGISDSSGTLMRRAKSDFMLNDNEEVKIYDDLVPLSSPRDKPPIFQRLYSRPHSLFKVSQRGTLPGAVHNPVDACFMPNGNLLVAEHDNCRLQEFSMDGRSVQFFKAPAFQPKGVCITPEGYVAVTDALDHNIKVFTRGADLTCKFGTGYFKDPSAVVTTGRDKYVINENVGAFQQYMFAYNAMTGEKERLGYNEHGDYVFNHPEYACVDNHTGDIFISDSGLHCIWVFSKHYKLKHRFGQQGDGDCEFNYPKGVSCYGDDGNILVSDCGNHRVVKYTSEGTFVETVLSKHDGLSYPQVVQVSKMCQIAVVQNAEVLVFQM